MKRSLFFMFFMFVCSFALILKPELAHANDDSELAEDYRDMMKDVKQKVINNDEESIENLESVKEFQNKYPNRAVEKFVQETEAIKYMNSKNKTLLEVGENEEKILEFDDGSFIVLSSELTELPTMSTLADFEGTHGKSYNYKVTQSFWGIYKTMEAHLTTYFTVYKTYINIYDLDTAGTKAYIGFSYLKNELKVVKNNAKSVDSKFSFTKKSLAAMEGLPIGFSTDHTLRTNITITKVSVSGSTVKFAINSTLQ